MVGNGKKSQIVKVEDHSVVNSIIQVMDGGVVYVTPPAPLSEHIYVDAFQALVEERTKTFVGREFIFRAINRHVQNPDFSSGYILIHGEPGIGKTSLMAQLVKQKGWVHHFNISLQNIRSAQDFLGNVCAQLIMRYDLSYRDLPPSATKNSAFLAKLLREASNKVPNQPVVILVDALDEAEDSGLPGGANRLYLPRALPDNVFFVVTTREKDDYRPVVEQHKEIYLRDDDPQNLADVRLYIRRFIQTHRDQMARQIKNWTVDEDEFVEVLTDKSEGNFMYLVFVLRDIRNGKLTFTNINNIYDLPQGLEAYYQRHWRMMRNQDPIRFEKYYEPVVCVLAVAEEPVSIRQIKEWTRISALRLRPVIRDWREFLNEYTPERSKPLYRIYHASFRDFLYEEVEVGLTSYHDLVAQRIRQKMNR